VVGESDAMPDARTVNETVYARLRDHILAGGAAIGQRLDERELSKQLGVSRTPVREAIGKLAADGIVDYRPHQGSFVRRLTVKEVQDLYTVRIELETLAVRLSMGKFGSGFLDTLSEIVDGTEAAMLASDLVEFARQDQRMHALFVDAADNSALADSLGRIENLIQMARNLANQRPGLPEATDVQRHALLDAFRQGDTEKAVAAMRSHIESVSAAIVAALESRTTHVLKPVV
jgi:DNA-binding GntR family transcriptional regulator